MNSDLTNVIDPQVIQRVRDSIDLPGDPAKTRIVVAMSGGVDSSVAAALVKCAGYDTLGITLQLYDHGAAIKQSRSCCAGQDIHDARRVAAHLDIPHYVLDFESRFRDTVIDDFADSYIRGETPIPCVRCNQTVKFSDLLTRAKDLEAACLVTGHYVASIASTDNTHRHMLTPADIARDQSYFLFATTQAQLDFLRFPLAPFGKAEIRQFGETLGLKVATKPDSQDICFVPEGRYQDIVRKLRPDADHPGDIVNLEGQVVGRHDGIINFTIGQRRGIGIAAEEPLYVIRIEPETARVVIGPHSALQRHIVALKELNWIGSSSLAKRAEEPVYVRVRSTRPPQAARLLPRPDGGTDIELEAGEFGISPGQACVIYDRLGTGAQVLGGGFISSTR